MSITSVTEIWSGETWSDELSGAREYDKLYRVISDNPAESAATVRSAGGIPALGAAYGADAGAFCRSRSARRIDDSRLVWEVTARFSTIENEEPADPLSREPKIRWTSQMILKPVIRDLNGDACVNSAGDYFDPPLEQEFPRWIVNIQWNATVVPTGILSYVGAINSGAIVIDGVAIAAERARVVGIDISEVQVENETAFRSITIGVEVRHADDDPFDVEALDQGYRIVDPEDPSKRVDILIEDEDGNSNRPSAPVLLDGSGGKLADPDPDNAVFITFETVPRADLTTFPGIGSGA